MKKTLLTSANGLIHHPLLRQNIITSAKLIGLTSR